LKNAKHCRRKDEQYRRVPENPARLTLPICTSDRVIREPGCGNASSFEVGTGSVSSPEALVWQAPEEQVEQQRGCLHQVEEHGYCRLPRPESEEPGTPSEAALSPRPLNRSSDSCSGATVAAFREHSSVGTYRITPGGQSAEVPLSPTPCCL